MGFYFTAKQMSSLLPSKVGSYIQEYNTGRIQQAPCVQAIDSSGEEERQRVFQRDLSRG
jgi:hypothetical protein